MRNLLFIFFTALIINANGQTLVPYKDTVNHFSIDIPTGWKYGVSKAYPSIILIAQKTRTGPADTTGDNFNINVIETPNKTLDKTFSDFLGYLPNAKDYKLIGTGDTSYNGMRLKWLIETHRENSNKQLHNYDFVALKNGKTYILTMVTSSSAFDAVKPLFDKIASSFQLIN
jgi:hypothetical protein